MEITAKESIIKIANLEFKGLFIDQTIFAMSTKDVCVSFLGCNETVEDYTAYLDLMYQTELGKFYFPVGLYIYPKVIVTSMSTLQTYETQAIHISSVKRILLVAHRLGNNKAGEILDLILQFGFTLVFTEAFFVL